MITGLRLKMSLWLNCACRSNGILSTTLIVISIVLFNKINNIYSNVVVSNAAESSSFLVYNINYVIRNYYCCSLFIILTQPTAFKVKPLP